jgi:hypothetical protein
MAIPHAKPGDIVDVRPLGSALASTQTTTLLRTEQIEVIRLVVPAGKDIAEHKVVRRGVAGEARELPGPTVVPSSDRRP